MSGLVHATITGKVVGYDVAAPVRFLYEPADPYAVVMDLTAICATAGRDSDPAVLWTFARSLLVRGLVGSHAGDGDVGVFLDGGWLDIALSSPDGCATFRFPAQAMHRFVVRTERAVLVGDESRHMAATIDAAVARLLGGVR